MAARQRIIPVRREYNRWVANQTLEDYALRFTAKSARHFSSQRIAQTAIGAISFLALEAIGGAISLSYGTTNAFYAIIVASLAMLAIGLPISRYAIRHGVDIDLLTRGAGFGYIGSTITSLIYAGFTFMLFAIEASIMSGALELALGIPLWIGYVVSAVMVIPLVTHGVRLISKFQLMTQPFWIVLNILPFLFIAFMDWEKFDLWRAFAGIRHASGPPGTVADFDLVEFGAASAVILALMSQIGEQADFLRFLPPEPRRKWRHRLAVFLAGPGWVVIGAPKLLAGSFLVVLTLASGVPVDRAADPAQMYLTAFGYMVPWHNAALLLMVAFVVVSQLKINVMNAYAGSLAWSNFFSRLTHSHPGRVIWLVFNVAIALLLMELGIYRLLEETLGIFSIVAMAWLCTIFADLFINKPLGLAPPGIEFKRAHLYDINPVGIGAMALSATVSLIAHFGAFGPLAASLAPYITLVVALIASPALAWATKGKFYLARKPRQSWKNLTNITCSVCEHPFEPEDMAWCPAYAAPICSLCCSLDSRCHDMCKPAARFNAQVGAVAKVLLPETILGKLATRLGRYGIAVVLALAAIGAILAMIAHQVAAASPETAEVVNRTILVVFFVFSVISGVVCWFYVLAHDSRVVAEEESSRQNTLLLKEIAAHKKTDAALQNAKEMAEAANRAKSRYVVGLSHELRTPLNAVLGYAQILERDETIPPPRQSSIRVIRRSAEHLSGLIDGLLDISKIEAGRLQVYSNEINIQDFLDQIVEMFRPQAQAKGLAFAHDRSPALPQFVRTDEKRLRQILVNLLSNAIKFTDEGSVTFDVGYRSQVATFTVADTGRGITEKDLPRIYEPFQRGEAESVRPMPGLGLGLTITRLLTNTLGGEISVSSVRDVGSTFRVRLMLSAVIRAAAPPQEKRIIGYDGSRRTVVVVDDNEDHREMMREILAPLDFIVLTAAGGTECLTLIDGIMPDLFLVDILMPGMNGWQLVSRLREAGQTAPMVMLSANIGDAAVLSDSDDSHNDTIGKPVDIRQLRDKLALHLGLKWIYADDAHAIVEKTETPILSPGPAHVQELLRLGEIGYIRGIEAKLSDLAKLEANRPFTEELRAYVASFDMAGFMTFLHDFDEKVESIG
ncbi:ATP-binding protein [Rhizobium lentis]|uniref:histidine kinase n=1 Tax=Rhizobium lentis TaxID=1138194 RepID=A0A7W8UME5_9HYPH|nr:ATP-binding protein [Rhizobium lentis]MBB4571887.1 signal transduction histidine kinase/DNA-binding NarL/FixJ family response regulator [Rhizobium lentis]MBB5548922.1 signal transduction histidine kinase/DNA-binding NarL/FixJ family response regulator [Rhizobium lentis]MBB5559455.1 signal transduction histidine kinase/DNA-binding NarL/FixJ family response regulator [Rhizobium lentis]MBB5565023.1 signal transduction histidine kinase/DNA-binding NarL/FixJ family response regulator [Rhizobium l